MEKQTAFARTALMDDSRNPMLPSYSSVTKEFLPFRITHDLSLPNYLQETYWWAYIHPNAVRFFERQWLVNLILWGNFKRLRDLALAEAGAQISNRILQVACVYGDFSPKLAARLTPSGRLDIVDVALIQLENVCRKIHHFNFDKDQDSPSEGPGVFLHHQDSTDLRFQDHTFDHVVVFFLLHEQPAGARAKTVAEALRVVKPGGKVIFVDYHKPTWTNPFRYIMLPILSTLEPFALDLWKKDIHEWIPKGIPIQSCTKETYFGGLYQKVVVVR